MHNHKPDARRWFSSAPPVSALWCALLCALLCLLVFPAATLAALEAERALLQKGDYAEAVTSLEAVVSRDPENSEAMALLLHGLLETGEYRRVLERGEKFLERSGAAAVAVAVAEAASRTGEYERAAETLAPFSTSRAVLRKGLLAKRKGQKETARAAFDQVVALVSRNRSAPAEELGDAAAALAELGQFQEANRLYREAVQAAPQNAGLKAAWGRLMLAKNNPGDAEDLFREALEANPNHTGAMLGMAERAAGRFEGPAVELPQRALKVNPNLADAFLLLARTSLEEEDYTAAGEQLDKALKVNPRLLEAWSLRAVSEYLQGRPDDDAAAEQEWIPRIHRENPHYGKVFEDLGDFSLLQHQFSTAVDFYRRAVETDPEMTEARASLGINLFRLGKEAEARRVLEEAYKMDPFNVWTVNTLRLMDSFTRFDDFETARFAVKLHQKESALLRPYVEDLLEEALTELISRYGYTPDQKVIFEMYPDHADFAVRTLGLPGLGALGASFGPVVAMDSPSARPLGTFHWASTLWHELAHVITLGMTSNRVPRWFTEGLSVYEENHARPGWGDPMTLGLIQILQEKGMIPLAELNGVFVRPQFPGQVPFAYFQAGMICEYIAGKYGFDKIRTMLRVYGDGRTDEEAFREALGKTLEDFDVEFLVYAEEQTYQMAEAVDVASERGEGVIAHLQEQIGALAPARPDSFFAQLRQAAELRKEGKLEEAARHAALARDLFPLYVEEGNPYELLAGIYTELGQKEKAVAEWMLWRELRGRDPETFKKLAAALHELGRTAEAAEVLEEALYISLADVEIHDRLGMWHLESGNAPAAVREYQAALTLSPADRAGAHYRLATAYRKLSDDRNARRQVLAALEIAPGYRPAQKLLLELSGK